VTLAVFAADCALRRHQEQGIGVLFLGGQVVARADQGGLPVQHGALRNGQPKAGIEAQVAGHGGFGPDGEGGPFGCGEAALGGERVQHALLVGRGVLDILVDVALQGGGDKRGLHMFMAQCPRAAGCRQDKQGKRGGCVRPVLRGYSSACAAQLGQSDIDQDDQKR